MTESSASQDALRPSFRRHPVWVYMVPIALTGGVTLVFLIDPEFYHAYVLHWRERERQVVEYITFLSALIGGMTLMWSTWKLWGRDSGSLFERGGTIGIGLIGLAALFFAGEEVSWGQQLLGWDTPEAIREHTVETNLHNTDLPVNSLGSLFLIVMFFVLPFMWRTDWPKPLPGTWRPVIAEAPVIFCMAFGFAWKEVKKLYQLVNPDYENIQTYHDFFEQFNEHKEMLVAVALLMYGVYRLRIVSLLDGE